MTLPHDEAIKVELLDSLAAAPSGRMHCQDVYIQLAKKFPMLTKDEREVPYRSSISHWANRVQWARHHLLKEGLILHPTVGGGRGYWTISEKGRTQLAQLRINVEQILSEFERL